MNTIEIYTTPICPYCIRAKMLLDSRDIAYQEYNVASDTDKLTEMHERSQRTSVPQIFIGEHHVGGSDDLMATANNGELEKLLNADAPTT